MPTRIFTRGLPLLAACLCAVSAADASAQNSNSLFGSNGAMSGSNGFSNGSTLSAGMGQSGMFGSSGMGTTGAGGLTGMTGQTGGAQGGAQGTTGQRRTTFVGQANTNRFVGSAQASPQQGAARFQGNRGAGGQGSFGQDGGFQNANGSGNNAGTAAQRIIRPQQRIAFNYRQPTAERTSAALSTRFKKLSDRVDVQGVTVETAGSTVTLRGTVDSEDARRLAGMLVGLEPGVRTVNNQITVKTN